MAQWESELTELVTRRGGALVGYAYTLCRDRGTAEDLVQDALVKVYSRLRRPPAPSDAGQQVIALEQPRLTNAEAYVRRAVLTIYLDGYRRGNHWSGLKHLLADEEHAPAADRVATARVDVGVALARLSPRQREAVVLRFFEDMTIAEVARTLGTRPGTIKRHLSNAMAVLREALAEVSVPEVETALDERLGAVTGAVRRRRAAKVGAVAGGVTVLAVLLASAAVWGPGRLRSEPVPPATPSPDTSAVSAVGAEGWAPSGWRGDHPEFECGADVAALASSSDEARIAITGDVEVVVGDEEEGDRLEVPVRITRSATAGPTLHGTTPVLVFAQDGKVVDLGLGPAAGRDGYELPEAGGSAAGRADAAATTACGPWTMDLGQTETYLEQRPAGTYDVYAAVLWSDHVVGAVGLAVSKPVTMDVPAIDVPEVRPLPVEIRDGYQPPWLEGTSLACGVRAEAIPGAAADDRLAQGLVIIRKGARDIGLTFDDAHEEPAGTTRTPFTLVWLLDGRVVDVGTDVWSEPVVRLREKGERQAFAELPMGEPGRTCLADPGAGLPGARYDLYVLAELDPGTGGERRFVALNMTEGHRYRAD
ncbi:RNA polymerase sigma factor [Promicromonospora sp. NPDC059942]|uniref:RNA polymerase sigma factor n=1 Tax=Promicromonospora sp. NPDC059942 TaxID=3347009 RepID=UPI00364FF843